MPRGRHAAKRPDTDHPNVWRPEPVRKRRPGWIAILGAVTILASGAYAWAGATHNARPVADNSAAPLFGVSANWKTLGPETAQFGHLPVVRWYYPGVPPANAWTTGPAAHANAAMVVSFKALPSAILSGADDAALAHFFDTAPTGHPIYYSYYHEPEDNIAAGQFTLAGYKAAWARVVQLADAAHNPDLHSTLILMSWDLNPASHRNFRDYIPPGGIISTLGWDAYPGDHAAQPTPPADFLGPAIAASKSVGLPFGFAEFALGTAAGRPGWLREVGSYLAGSGALFATYFDSTGWPTMELTDPSSITAWRGIIAESNPGARPHHRLDVTDAASTCLREKP